MPDVYLDHAATTDLRPEAADAVARVLGGPSGNPSGAHRRARAARRLLDDARDEIAAFVGAEPAELVFTSGGTEANDLAVRGVIGAVGGVPICTAVEHRSVIDPVEAVGGRTIEVDGRGRVDLDRLAEAIDAVEPTLVSVMAANNETGSRNDLGAVADVISGGALLHTDAIAAAPWVGLSDATARADLVSLSGHKIGGPPGIGALVVRRGTPLEAMLIGGGQEMERRAGTPAVAAAVAFAAAARATARDRDDTLERVEGLRDELIAGLAERIPEIAVLSPTTGDRTAGTVMVGIPGVERETLLLLLDEHGIAASWGSSCSSGASETSHVLTAMGVDPAAASGSLRLSLGWSSTADDVAAVLATLPPIVDRLRGGPLR